MDFYLAINQPLTFMVLREIRMTECGGFTAEAPPNRAPKTDI